MQKYKIHLIATEEEKELIAMANSFTDVQKLLKAKYTLEHYQAITIRTLCTAKE